MESRFGHDFTSVRVHADSAASSSATRMDAAAYTIGDHIAFRSSLYSPGTPTGQRLIAHELAHVVQQRGRGTASPSSSAGPHEIAAEQAAATVAGGGRVSHALSATAVGVARQMYPPHARGYVGEQGMGFEHYPAEKGWIFIEGPSGWSKGGHKVTAPGIDGVPYNTNTDELHLADNKSFGRPGEVTKATAIDPEKTLLRNVEKLIGRVEGAEHLPPRVRTRVLELLRQTQQALSDKNIPLELRLKRIPSQVKLVVTHVGGQTTSVSDELSKRRIESPQQAEPAPPAKHATVAEPAPGKRPPVAEAPRRGGGRRGGSGGGLLGVALPFALGWVYSKAVEAKIDEQTKSEGYAPPGRLGGIFDLGALFFDPFNDADRAVGIDARLDFPAWRARAREIAGRKQPGETLTMTWDVGRCQTDFFGRQTIENRALTYKKQPDGRWMVVSGNPAGTPDLNAVISTEVPDAEIKGIMMSDPCTSAA
jgi:hypothetical protein